MRTTLDVFIAVSLLASLAIGCDRPLTFDANGVPHGTGEKVNTYQSGAVRSREQYKNGKLILSRWYKPDGILIQETRWSDGAGEGIYLREDGTIKKRMQYVDGVAEGEAVDYDESGNVIARRMYHAGRPVATTSPE